METFPPRLGSCEEFMSSETFIEIIAREPLPGGVFRGKLTLDDLHGELQVFRVPRGAIKQTQPVGRGEIHLGRTGIDEARLLVAEEAIAKEVTDLAGRVKGCYVLRVVEVEQQPNHHV